MSRSTWLVALTLFAASGNVAWLPADEFEKDPIRYSTTEPNNVVSRLAETPRLGQGEAGLDQEQGYLARCCAS